jgi:predicted adenylyl cyclase CyaB
MTKPSSNLASSRNIELKARCADLDRAAAAAVALGATPAGELIQLDTYFQVPHGRLKLRETQGKPAELIAYSRADSTEFRDSDYTLVPIAHPEELKLALKAALGVRGEVRKRRTLLMWHNVRVHLDDVEGIGTFLEFEAVIAHNEEEANSRDRLATLSAALAIAPADRIAQSYGDLLGL